MNEQFSGIDFKLESVCHDKAVVRVEKRRKNENSFTKIYLEILNYKSIRSFVIMNVMKLFAELFICSLIF